MKLPSLSAKRSESRGNTTTAAGLSEAVKIPVGRVILAGELSFPPSAKGIVLFAHGSGSSRFSPRNRYVAKALQDAGVATLLFDLLTAEEEAEDDRDGHLRFDIGLLATRLEAATVWTAERADTQRLGIGYFGSSTGGAAALVAAAQLGRSIQAVVSRGGRPDLAGPALRRVLAPTLLIVGARDELVLDLNEEASAQMECTREVVVVPGATHLFEEPGALEQVAALAAGWFTRYLKVS